MNDYDGVIAELKVLDHQCNVQKLDNCLKTCLPTSNKLCRLVLTAPVSTASNERAFSKLKIIKNYLRSIMGANRLQHLMLLYSNKDILDSLDLKSARNHSRPVCRLSLTVDGRYSTRLQVADIRSPVPPLACGSGRVEMTNTTPWTATIKLSVPWFEILIERGRVAHGRPIHGWWPALCLGYACPAGSRWHGCWVTGGAWAFRYKPAPRMSPGYSGECQRGRVVAWLQVLPGHECRVPAKR
ncbi:Uncharacterized protein FWK35_00024040 [Aphis craccivora]|uniref:HAT C-terminal dimerisation domain-containing protein n=1 Tax=Aphis craccivora TaxID=307492 RepID=A0A6G0W2E2_APHCR|nr:Uncharacterized protein FWK35_00024040 [Aphis craccivora]